MLNTFKTTVVSFFPGRLRVSIGDCTPSWSVSGNFSLSFFLPVSRNNSDVVVLIWLGWVYYSMHYSSIRLLFEFGWSLYHHSVGRNNTNTLILAPREKIKITLTQSPKKKLFAKKMTTNTQKEKTIQIKQRLEITKLGQWICRRISKFSTNCAWQ